MCAEASRQEKERIKSKVGKVTKLKVMLQKLVKQLKTRVVA